MTIQISPKLPLGKMTFAPDIPSAALGANEYNAGANIETDVRGIRSQAGDQEILDSVPGTPTFVTSGFRQDGYYWFIVASIDETGNAHWYANRGDNRNPISTATPTTNGGTWIEITPPEIGRAHV